MKTECEKQILEGALKVVGKAINGRSPLRILSHFRLEAKKDTLEVYASDLDIGLRMAVPAQVVEPGAVCVPGKLFAEIISKLPAGPVTLEAVEEARLRIAIGRSKFEVATLPPEEFPEWRTSSHPDINVPEGTFKRLVGHVIDIPPTGDESRAVMTGILTKIDEDKLVMVATDGHRLAFANHTLPDALNAQACCIVPKKAMDQLARACGSKEAILTVRVQDSQLFACVNGLQMYCRLLENHFPDYKRVIPDTFQRACRVGREALAAGLKRMLVVALERQSPNLIVFDFSPEKLTLSANTPDVGLGTEELPCIFEGADLRIAFNGKYVLDALQALACEEVQLDLQDDTRSAVVREYGESDFLHVLMPVRLREVVVEEAEQQEVVAV